MEIRRFYDRIISIMGLPTLVRQNLYIESWPCLSLFFNFKFVFGCSGGSFLLPSATIGTDGYCCRSLRPSVRSSVCLSVCPSRTTLPLLLFKDFGYQSKIWWDDAQYHGTHRYLKWPCSTNFCVFHGTLKFSMIGFLDQVSGTTLPL